MVRRFALLVAGTAVGGWLAVRLQLGVSGYWQISDELYLAAIVLIGALLLVVFLFLPMSFLIERFAAPAAVGALVIVGSTLAALAFGVWIYVGFLHRSFALVVERDLPYLLCFAFVGIGYAIAHRIQKAGKLR